MNHGNGSAWAPNQERNKSGFAPGAPPPNMSWNRAEAPRLNPVVGYAPRLNQPPQQPNWQQQQQQQPCMSGAPPREAYNQSPYQQHQSGGNFQGQHAPQGQNPRGGTTPYIQPDPRLGYPSATTLQQPSYQAMSPLQSLPHQGLGVQVQVDGPKIPEPPKTHTEAAVGEIESTNFFSVFEDVNWRCCSSIMLSWLSLTPNPNPKSGIVGCIRMAMSKDRSQSLVTLLVRQRS